MFDLTLSMFGSRLLSEIMQNFSKFSEKKGKLAPKLEFFIINNWIFHDSLAKFQLFEQ